MRDRGKDTTLSTLKRRQVKKKFDKEKRIYYLCHLILQYLYTSNPMKILLKHLTLSEPQTFLLSQILKFNDVCWTKNSNIQRFMECSVIVLEASRMTHNTTSDESIQYPASSITGKRCRHWSFRRKELAKAEAAPYGWESRSSKTSYMSS